MAVFASRQIVMPVLTIAVTITGQGGDEYCCYAIINGTKQYRAGTHEVNAGDTITFGVFGQDSMYNGTVTIDGTRVLNVDNSETRTYDWIVPEVSTVKIAMNYQSGKYGITVTTA